VDLLPKYSQLKDTRIDLARAIPLKKPFTVLFEPASRCNFRCTYCFYSNPDLYSHMPKGLMRFEDFTKIAADLASWEGERIKVVRIIGFGEPFLNKNTAAMVKHLKDLAVADRIEITSNGSLMTPGISRQLIDAGLDYLRISIYAASQNRHDAVTRSKVSIDLIKSNIAELSRLRKEHRSTKPFIYVKMLDSFNEEENQRFIQHYSHIADEVALETPHHWLSDDASLDGLIEGGTGRVVCPQPFKMLSIRFNGDVIVCDPDWKNKTKVGNALEEPLAEIWNGRRLREFWKMQLEKRRWENESCRQCTFITSDEYVLDRLEDVPASVLGGI
jgi:GTP 3',8-cyclase